MSDEPKPLQLGDPTSPFSRYAGPADQSVRVEMPADEAEGRKMIAEAQAGLAQLNQQHLASLPPAAPFRSVQDFQRSQRSGNSEEHMRRLAATPQSEIDGWEFA